MLAVLENSVLPMGRDSSHETLKVTLVVYKRWLRAVTKTSVFLNLHITFKEIIDKPLLKTTKNS